jgi:hypothetical protein
MEELKIEILDPEALKLIRELEERELIRISPNLITKLQAYLIEMRKNADSAPSSEEIADLVQEVRSGKNDSE